MKNRDSAEEENVLGKCFTKADTIMVENPPQLNTPIIPGGNSYNPRCDHALPFLFRATAAFTCELTI